MLRKVMKKLKNTLFEHSLPHFYHLAKLEHCPMHQSKVRVEKCDDFMKLT